MDERLGIDGAYSQGVKRVLIRLAVLLPYAKASELADELASIKVSDSSIWEMVQAAGQRTQSALHRVTSQKQSSSENMGLALDGCLMNIRKEGWKEAKLGVVFEIEANNTPDPADAVSYVKCTQQSCVIHLGGPEGLSNLLFAEARARGFGKATQQAVLGDGADWIWKIADGDYPKAAQINDWYHACQHLHSAAAMLFPAAPEQLAAWTEHQKHVLYGGGADLVANAIRATQKATHVTTRTDKQRALLETEAAFFGSRFERMQYADFRDAGLPIGSGVVESTAKQTKHRMSAAGMRWSRPGATNMLPFLAAELSGTLPAYLARIRP